MSFLNNRPAVSIDLLKLPVPNSDDKLLTELPSPAMQMAKKRLSKLSNRKTNEELIKESHDELMNYVDNVDAKVQAIIKTYEAEFLQAYLQHIKKVREEMENIKKKSLSAANSERTFQDKIDALEKQLVIFRQDSLQSYQKVMIKDKQINLLKSRVAELQKQLQIKEKTIYNLIKITKEYETVKQQIKNTGILQEKTATVTQIEGKNLKIQKNGFSHLYSPIAKHLLLDGQCTRPLSMQTKDKQYRQNSLQLSSTKKANEDNEILEWLRKKIIQRIGDSEMVPVSFIFNLISQRNIPKQTTSRRGPKNSFKEARNSFMARMDSRRSHCGMYNYEQKNPKEIAQNNQLMNIFRRCVEEVKKEVARRNKIPSLNFFKENGPKSYLEFKKVDYFQLIEMLITNDSILQKLYQIIFDRPN